MIRSKSRRQYLFTRLRFCNRSQGQPAAYYSEFLFSFKKQSFNFVFPKWKRPQTKPGCTFTACQPASVVKIQQVLTGAKSVVFFQISLTRRAGNEKNGRSYVDRPKNSFLKNNYLEHRREFHDYPVYADCLYHPEKQVFFHGFVLICSPFAGR